MKGAIYPDQPLPKLTAAQAQALRAVAREPGGIRQGMMQGQWHRALTMGFVCRVHQATIKALLQYGLLVAKPTPRETTRAVLVLTDLGCVWFNANLELMA